MHSSRHLTTISGAPVDNMRTSETIGPRGPVLLQDSLLQDQLQIFTRENIPPRVVHARGMSCKGEFMVTQNLSDITTADFLQKDGQRTPIAVRFSTVIPSHSSPEFLRDPRGFAVKFYTNQGNYDVLALNWPIFFIKDGIRFPDAVHALKPNPITYNQEFWRIWDYFAHYPESMHAMTYYMDDLGIPRSYRHLNGWSINTFKMLNRQGQETLFRWHFQSLQGEEGLIEEVACQEHYSFHTLDLQNAINRGEYPRYRVMIQTMDPNVMPPDFDPLDATKEWPIDRFPLREVGELHLNENIKSFFLENEQIAFAVSRLVPGIAPTDDKLLQARLFAYSDAQRYRIGINNQMLPINAPRCPFVDQHSDGHMNFSPISRSGREINYYPSMIDPSLTEAPPLPKEYEMVEGRKGRIEQREADEFVQAGNRWRSFDAARQLRFADRIAISLTGNRMNARLREIWVGNWTKADAKLGALIRENLELLMAPNPGLLSDAHQKRLAGLLVHQRYMNLTGPMVV